MKKYMRIAAAAAAAAVMTTSVLAANTTKGLTDIDGYWGKKAVQYFYDNHYVSGDQGKFRPNEDITREGIAAVINNLLGEDAPAAAASFSDVKGRWSERAISSVTDKQIMQGYSNGTFRPGQKITREEFAVIAYNYMTYKGMEIPSGQVSYKDKKQISSWAETAVNSLAAGGYMTGANQVFNPKAYVTRGEAVNVLYRMVTGLKQTQQTEGDVQTRVFSDVKEVYGSIQNFAKDGIMYWQGNTLHIGVKDKKNKEKLADAIAKDTAIPAETVTVQTATYSYDDYKNMMAQAEKVYRASEPTDAAVKTDVDYLNEKVVLTVKEISKDTQTKLSKELGGALRIVIQ